MYGVKPWLGRWRRHCGGIRIDERSDEPITTPGNGFNVAWFVGRIREHVAQLLYGAVQSGVEIDEGVPGPEPLPEFFARNNIAGMLQQQR